MVYVLKIRLEGEEDDVFLFHSIGNAWRKIYEYFNEPMPRVITEETINDLEEKYFVEDKGYWWLQRMEVK